jgi:hypothetical protein
MSIIRGAPHWPGADLPSRRFMSGTLPISAAPNAGVIEHLKHYARPELAAALAGIERISGDHYDWALNDLRE